MFSTVFIDISLIFVQLGLENFGKTVRDPPLLLPSREVPWSGATSDIFKGFFSKISGIFNLNIWNRKYKPIIGKETLLQWFWL